MIILDGAADRYRNSRGLSPLQMADMPYTDKITALGRTGLVQTLFPDLPKESLVAQLGMLGWDPYRYYPMGRASAELLATCGIHLNEKDLAFRANFITMENARLKSYNAGYIRSEASMPLVQRINDSLQKDFEDIQLYHNSDFRNTLVIKSTEADPAQLVCIEPHESEDKEIHINRLVYGREEKSRALAERLNDYLYRVHDLLGAATATADAIVPWSVSRAFRLPAFNAYTGFEGKAAVVGAMDFLHGMAIAGGIEFFKRGDGSPSTDYAGKGDTVIRLLEEDYSFVLCHINAPDEASHMHSLPLKIDALEKTDRFIVKRVYDYFSARPEMLGGVMIVPDHYTNTVTGHTAGERKISHSLEPVPFAVWNGDAPDEVCEFNETSVECGYYGPAPLRSLSLMNLLINR